MASRRVDSLLRKELALSGSAVKRAKAAPDGITLDGRIVHTDERAAAGQTLSVVVGDSANLNAPIPKEGPLKIVYEDQDLLILDKQAGAAVHPSPGHYDDTIGNFIMDYYQKRGLAAGYHPVNRLDRGTSGLMVLSKHGYGQERLKAQLHTNEFLRTYLAICDGIPEPCRGVVDAPIGRSEGEVLRREVRSDGEAASTRYETLSAFGGRALVRLELRTGRTHQIRVHMAYLGCPLTGDFLYGKENKELIGRAALHSAHLELTHPVTGRRLVFDAPLPADMRRLIDLQ
ncbi:Ribosomal large subunit pseudouridine synthase D [bioreactor metagenome]|uniref:Ribosomal large subunit pseudouridine synthase D n=1 Tax=bioreactor metagenome TaxID=1076179 RepID=A0A644XHI8_9ZZZZ